MTATLLDGKTLAGQIQGELAEQIAEFIQNNGQVPCLAAVLVGEDPASQVYVRSKQRACGRVGMDSKIFRLAKETDEDDLLALVTLLNKDRDVHGILVQLPLPDQIRTQKILDAISPAKDVDAFHPENVGLLSQGRPRFLPCTPRGVQELLFRHDIETAGRHVVILGRSDLVGKPLASMLAQRDSLRGPSFANGTVTVCHSRTANIAQVTRQADVLIVAIGQPKFVTAEMVKPGAAVIDVGINRTEEGLVGDVDFEAVRGVAAYITPVPGGVGPLTIAMLLTNTLSAAVQAQMA